MTEHFENESESQRIKSRKYLRYAVAMCLMVMLTLCCTGCSIPDFIKSTISAFGEHDENGEYVSYEDKVYCEAVDSFFEAVESGDADAVRAQFSVNAQKEAADLDEQIALLIEGYSGPTQEYGNRKSRSSGEHTGGGKRSNDTQTHFALVSNGVYYWCWFDLVYRDDFDPDNIGIRCVDFYSIEYACALEYKEKEAQNPEGDGLHVSLEYPYDLGCDEVRVIEGYPYKYTNHNRTVDIEEVKAYLEKSNSYSGLAAQFGEPDAANIYYYWTLPDENGEHRYLLVSDDDREDTIYAVNIVDDLHVVQYWWNDDDGFASASSDVSQ